MRKNKCEKICKYVNKYLYLQQNNKNSIIMRTANYTEYRKNLKHYLDGVINDNEPLIVHRAGTESVVVISLEDYNAMKETEYIMKSPAMMDAIRKGEQDIKNGNCITQNEGESIDNFLNRVLCTE